jgi:multidrug efflux pump subunit AcrA (membrane-fusion protein)
LGLAAAVAVLCALPAVGAEPMGTAAPGAVEPGVVDANTRPAQDHEIKATFALPGLVSEVYVKEGDHVKAGQILAKQDDRQDAAELERIQIEADSMAKIENYQLDQAIKQVQLDRMKKLHDEYHDAASSEVEQAQLDVELAKTQVDLGKLEHEQKKLDAKKQEIKVELMKLVSPIDGIVEKLNINPGEMASADPQNHDGSIIVVQNDPLWVEMNLSTAAAMQLQMGQILPVKYSWENAWRTAKIIYFAPQADAKSDTQLVRLELDNPSGATSGVHMQVKLPEKIAALAASDAGNP